MSKKRLRYGKMAPTGNMATLPMPVQTHSIYQNLSDLPLNKFIECLVDGNLSALIKSGYPTPGEMQTAWRNLFMDYTDLLGTAEYVLYKLLYKEISILEITLSQIELLAGDGKDIKGYLSQVYNKYLCDELNNLLKTNINFNPDDEPSYQEALKKCVRRSWAIRVKLDLKKMKFEAIKAKQETAQQDGGTVADRAYFVGVLINLSDHARYPILDTITVLEYCERIKRLNNFLETLNRKQNGRK